MLTLPVCRDGRILSRRRIGQGVLVGRPDPLWRQDALTAKRRKEIATKASKAAAKARTRKAKEGKHVRESEE